jgi:alpha-galactosidase
VLTGRAWAVIWGGGALWVASRVVGAPDLHMAAVGLLALVPMVALLVRVTPPKLQATRRLSTRRAFPGTRVRVDLEILERTDRIWGSDMTDPLERQQIQRWTAQLIPPELIGSHVAAPRSHSTARTHDLSFRAGTALFGSFGIEWDVTTTGPEERKELAAWVQLYKDVRGLLHTGTMVRADQHDPSFALHGVVAPDRGDALYALVQLATPLTSVPGQLRLPGLDPARRFRVAVQPPGDRPVPRQRQAPSWLARGVELPGRVLAEAGLRAPALNPEQLLLLRVTEVA